MTDKKAIRIVEQYVPSSDRVSAQRLDWGMRVVYPERPWHFEYLNSDGTTTLIPVNFQTRPNSIKAK